MWTQCDFAPNSAVWSRIINVHLHTHYIWSLWFTWFLFSCVFYKNTTHVALVIKATEGRKKDFGYSRRIWGRDEEALGSLLDISVSRTKNRFLKTHLPANSPGKVARKNPNDLALMPLRVWVQKWEKKGVSIFVIFMKGKPKTRKKEKASRAGFRGRGEKPFL